MKHLTGVLTAALLLAVMTAATGCSKDNNSEETKMKNDVVGTTWTWEAYGQHVSSWLLDEVLYQHVLEFYADGRMKSYYKEVKTGKISDFDYHEDRKYEQDERSVLLYLNDGTWTLYKISDSILCDRLNTSHEWARVYKKMK